MCSSKHFIAFFFFFTKTIQNSVATVINVALSELQSFTWYSKVLILNQNIFVLKGCICFKFLLMNTMSSGWFRQCLKRKNTGVNSQNKSFGGLYQCRQNNPTPCPWNELFIKRDQCCWIVNAFACGLHSNWGGWWWTVHLNEWLWFLTLPYFKMTYNIKIARLKDIILSPFPE